MANTWGIDEGVRPTRAREPNSPGLVRLQPGHNVRDSLPIRGGWFQSDEAVLLSGIASHFGRYACVRQPSSIISGLITQQVLLSDHYQRTRQIAEVGCMERRGQFVRCHSG